VAERLAENLSHGDQRRLEIGLVLARDPDVLLLDEPLAGMSPTETHATVELIQRISPGPHDHARRTRHGRGHVDLDLDHGDADGQVLAVGTPDEIRANEAVQRAYLGGLAYGWPCC
jgi:branched-chain amino acid transport system ATP-binding protein